MPLFLYLKVNVTPDATEVLAIAHGSAPVGVRLNLSIKNSLQSFKV